ncbi:unnamed protein product [Ectocarpus fasciculatus]
MSASPATAALPLHSTAVRLSDPALMSRLLYSNPVCLLTTGGAAAEEQCNVMVISWLTPVDNYGHIFLSMNVKRFTSQLLSHDGAVFVLNVPVAGMEGLITAVGKCSGRDTDKFSALGINTCPPGWVLEAGGDSATETSVQPVALTDCVAHVVCVVNQMQRRDPSDDGSGKRKKKDDHYYINATITTAYVQERYWDGKCFAAISDSDPATLTFLGSGNFGSTRRCS